MIHGLRLAMSGAEMIAAISDRIERHRATIQQKREEIERGQKSADGTHCPLCEGSLEEDIASYEHRIETLMLIREHILPAETYSLGRDDLEFGELLPEPPGLENHLEISNGIQWAAPPPQAESPVPVTSSSGD